MKNIIYVLVLASVLVSTSVYGAVVTGYGNKSCDRWTIERYENSFAAMFNEAWMLGFLSGVAFTDSTGMNIIEDGSVDDLFVWISKFCMKYPQKKIFMAAMESREHPRNDLTEPRNSGDKELNGFRQ